ncbi:hypothetical protein MM213_15580 [Belliella sp. R4-6]|uniref:Outer membrane protein beta-barrel domain-containing protein n=1 Tax=Belliella alkalica TaxID=1730871 RepID=A0ABS9VEQ7_9BACT|nr:hypothetical protein [Belliella alkalica]MCH7414921.1 hypothetical protein [Belliella alkalica]
MKKLLILLAFVPLVSFGQFSKGTKMIGGNASYFSSKTEIGFLSEPARSVFSMNGHLGFFVSESLVVGPKINVSRAKYPFLNPSTNQFFFTELNGISGGLFVRKFFQLNESFYFSLEGSGMIGKTSRASGIPTVETSETQYRIAITPAFTFMPNKKWGIEAGVGELSYNSKWSNIENSDFRANLGQVNLGINYFFGR